MEKEFEVIIIGGGPAGMCAAIACARNKARVLLIEKRAFPINKPCGEGIMPTGLAHLDALGMTPFLIKRPHHPFLGIRYISANGKIAESPFAEGPGWGIQRTELSMALWERAKQLEDLTILENTRPAFSWNPEKKPLIWIEGKCFSPNLLIGADGIHSEVRKWAGLAGKKKSLKRWGVRRHYQIQPWSQFVEVYWKPGVEAYITPVSAHSIGIAFLWDFKKILNMRGGAKLFDSLLECFPKIQDQLRGVSFIDTPMATGPLYQTASSPTQNKVLLIGDAAGYLDAITGEGISLAAEQALAFEKIVVPVLAKKQYPSSKIVRQYVQTYTKIVRPYYEVTHLVLWLRQHPQLVERVIHGLAREPDVFQRMLSINMGMLPPWSISWNRLLKFGKHLLIPE